MKDVELEEKKGRLRWLNSFMEVEEWRTSRPLEEGKSKIIDEQLSPLEACYEDKTQRKIDTQRFTQAEFLYSKYVVNYKRQGHLFIA